MHKIKKKVSRKHLFHIIRTQQGYLEKLSERTIRAERSLRRYSVLYNLSRLWHRLRGKPIAA